MKESWKSIGLGEKKSAIIIRNVPESLRRELKSIAAKTGKSMQGIILELITKFVVGKEGI